MDRVRESRYKIPIPSIDVLSFIFSSGDELSRQRPSYFDAFRPERCYSLAEGEALAKRIGLGLRDLGVKEDDKIVLYSGNNLYNPVVLWGVIASGAVYSAVSPTASLSELETQLKDLGASILITSVGNAKTAHKAAASTGIPSDRVFILCDPRDEERIKQQTSTALWTSFWAAEERASQWKWRTSTDRQWLSEKTIIINYSSGTTGAPKGVEITHLNVVSNSCQLVYHRTKQPDPMTTEAEARIKRLNRSGERWLAPLPMYHAYGQMYYCVNAPRMSAKVFIMANYNIKSLLLFLDAYRITFLTGVPAILVQISKQRPGIFNLNSLDYALTGSAPLGPDIAAKIEKDFLPTGLPLKNGWGMTETTCSISGFTPDDINDGRAVGYLNPNTKAIIKAVEGQDWKDDIPAGAEAGELWVSGDNITKGYWNRPEATRETIVMEKGERFLKTGDVAYVDDSGKIYIIDRLKELIKVKGMQVSPSELEAAILDHDGVEDCAVVGAKIDHGEYPRAFVVKKDPALKEQDVHNIIQSKFSKHKWLTGGVFFIDQIPKTGSGKVMRRMLPQLKNARALKL